MNANILESLKKSAAVPSMPQVVLRFLQIMQEPDFEYDHLVKALSADPGTVGELLRLSNSALFGVRNKVVSTKQALTLLGPKRTRSLILGRYLVDSMSKNRPKNLDMGYFWRRSLTGSVIASRFAQKQIPRAQDEAFIGALLADIGIPILIEAFPDAYAPIAAQYGSNGNPVTPEQELEAVEVTHVHRPGPRLHPDVHRPRLETRENALHRERRLLEPGRDERRDTGCERRREQLRADGVDV